jgi:DNA-binding response OmpR family regulator
MGAFRMTKKELLICDDNKRFCLGLKLILEEYYNVTIVSDGKQVFDVVSKINIDLVLLDYDLRTINGTNIIKRIKNSFPKIKIIMVTGHEDADVKSMAFGLGVDDYIIKPFKTKDLLEAIQIHLIS